MGNCLTSPPYYKILIFGINNIHYDNHKDIFQHASQPSPLCTLKEKKLLVLQVLSQPCNFYWSVFFCLNTAQWLLRR